MEAGLCSAPLPAGRPADTACRVSARAPPACCTPTLPEPFPPHTKGNGPGARSNLFDVFRNIADDEREHVKTMTACRDYSIVDDLARKKLTSKEPTLPPGAGVASSSTPNLVVDSGPSNGK